MALTINEGTKQKTMDIINSVMGFPANTIKYARIFASWKTRDGYPGKAFTSMLDLYVDENPEKTQITKLHYEFGCNIPESAVHEMSTTDDEAVLYKHLEYIINFQDAQRRQQTDPTFDAAAEQAELDALRDELGIETLFRLIPDAPADTATDPDPA